MKKHLSLLLAIAMLSCSQGEPSENDGELGLSVVMPSATTTNASLIGKSVTSARSTLRIKHSMLGKPFLYMLGEFEKRDPRRTTEYWDYGSYHPRLVNFTSDGHTIYLADILPRLPFDTESQATHKIIAAFPILSDNGKTIEFDFAKGMEILASWYSQFNWDSMTTPPPYSTILTSTSSKGSLTIDQQLQFSLLGSHSTWILRHVFSTTLAKSTMEPRKPDESGRVGYLLTSPWYSAGSLVPHQYIERWSLDHPIRFAVSTNTPTQYRDAIIQGVLDWNQAFGKDILQLVDGLANVTPLDPRVDIAIMWSENDNRGLAYATNSAHPQTGQIVHGDVVIFSGWAAWLMKESEQLIPDRPSTSKSHGDFISAKVCEYSNSEYMETLATQPEMANNKQLRDQFLQKILQAVTRHELGHILGLRHNFAGNLGGTMSETEIAAGWQSFLDNKEQPPEGEPSSSIMDYLPSMHETFMPKAASYDQVAIRWGYFSSIGSIPSSDTPTFCSDEDADETGVADCLRHDGGQEPLTYIDRKLSQYIQLYIKDLLKNTTLTQKDLDKVAPNIPPSTFQIERSVIQLQRYLTLSTSVLTINEKYPMERREMAERILQYYQSIQNWGTPELIETAGRLKQMIWHGSKADSYWAEEVLVRLVLGVQKLQSVLDAPRDVGQKPTYGTTTDFDFGS